MLLTRAIVTSWFGDPIGERGRVLTIEHKLKLSEWWWGR